MEHVVSQVQLPKDAADGPDVDGWPVQVRAKQLLWRPIDDGRRRGRVLPVGRTVDLGRVKVDQLQHSVRRNNHIGRLQISVHDPARVQVRQALEHLLQQTLDVGSFQHNIFALDDQAAQINRAILESKVDQVFVVEDVPQFYDVWMLQLLQELDFSQQ